MIIKNQKLSAKFNSTGKVLQFLLKDLDLNFDNKFDSTFEFEI